MTDLERVMARAVECGIYGANKTLLNATPRVLLAFEQATLKEANETIERLKDAEESNKAVELALEDVPYKGSYADGIEYLKQLQREKDGFELFGYIEPRKNFEPMEAEAVYIVGEKDFDGCSVALYRRKE